VLCFAAMASARLLSPLLVGSVLFGLLAPRAAHAECKAAYTSAELVNDLTSSQLALRNLDEATFTDAGKRLETGVGCVSNAIPPMVFASAYRYIGAYRYLEHDTEGARKWFRTSLELDASYQLDANELELDNPIRQVFEEERDTANTPPTKVEGKILSQPAGSTFALDGRPLAVAAATPERPHILQQIATADKSVRGTWVLDGASFPAQVLQDASMAAPTPEEQAKLDKEAKKAKTKVAKEAPKEKVANVEYTDSGALKVDRVRPAEKTPLMVVGAVAIAGAGGLYAASFLTHEQFLQSKTTEQVTESQTLTNALVLTSGGVLLAGLGVGYWGVILDGGAGVGISGHF